MTGTKKVRVMAKHLAGFPEEHKETIRKLVRKGIERTNIYGMDQRVWASNFIDGKPYGATSYYVSHADKPIGEGRKTMFFVYLDGTFKRIAP